MKIKAESQEGRKFFFPRKEQEIYVVLELAIDTIAVTIH